MVIECFFCSNYKLERYLYTECGHLVCINCAALRSDQTLECCKKITYLDGAVKTELKNKKQAILSNLQNEYEYERTDLKKIGFSNIEERLIKIQALQSKQKRITEMAFQNQQQNINQQFQSNRWNQLYKNPKVFEEKKYIVSQSTPIKQVSNKDEEVDKMIQESEKSGFYHASPQKNILTQIYQRKNIKTIDKNVFIPILQNQIRLVRQNFQTLQVELQKMQAKLVYQIKVYFEEYLKLIQKKSNTSFDYCYNIETQTQKFTDQWKINEIKDFIQSKNHDLQQKHKQKIQLVKLEFAKQTNPKRGLPQQSCRLNYPSTPQNYNLQQNSLQNLRINEKTDQESKVCHPVTTDRNLDKIYKKLEQSKSKLQERIKIHNNIMSKRCLRVGQY